MFNQFNPFLSLQFSVTNAEVICNPCPSPSHLRGWAGYSGANVRGSDFLSTPQCRVSAGLVILFKYTPVEFIIIITSRPMTLRRSPHCRALMDEKSLSPLVPVVGDGDGDGGGGGQWLQMTGA